MPDTINNFMSSKMKCTNCEGLEKIAKSVKLERFAVPQLSNLLKVTTEHVCPKCGGKSSTEPYYCFNQSVAEPRISGNMPADTKRGLAVLTNWMPSLVYVQYRAISRTGEDILFPTDEGEIRDGSLRGNYGDSDLMIEFALEYFNQYQVAMPKMRLPKRLSELMPALLLLVISVELAMKAYLLRSGAKNPSHHDLGKLYEALDVEHKKCIEQKFTDSMTVQNITKLGVSAPSLKAILKEYSQSRYTQQGVYMDAKYYAESTITLPKSSQLKGSSFGAGTPYPIFLPVIAQALIDTYEFYSGNARLKRMGAKIQKDINRTLIGHRDWKLVPSSLDLVVVEVAYKDGKDSKGADSKPFKSFKRLYPTELFIDWMRGGGCFFLFYKNTDIDILDGKRILNGFEFQVRRDAGINLHKRDLYLLADAIEASNAGEKQFGLPKFVDLV